MTARAKPKGTLESRFAVLEHRVGDLEERLGPMGAFLPGGKREKPHLIFKRDTALNNRIGQALGRLERSFTVKKFVRPAVPA